MEKARAKVFRMPARLVEEMDTRVRTDGYKNNRSRWIREAYRGMIVADPELMRAGTGGRAYGKNNVMISMTAPPEFWDDLHQGVLQLRRQVPLFDGPASTLLRSAIVFRLENQAPFNRKSA